MDQPIETNGSQNVDASVGSRILRRLRHELMLEIGFVAICLMLAIGLEGKIALAVVLACLKFAVPDWGTAYLVLRYDPTFAHGVPVSLLFVATGLARASVFAFAALLIGAFLFVAVFNQMGWRNPAAVGLGTGFFCAFGFLASIFPLTLASTAVSYLTSTKLSFAGGLTKLRRQVGERREMVRLDVPGSLRKIGFASGISLSVCLISLLFLLPLGKGNTVVALSLLAGSFILPFVWMARLSGGNATRVVSRLIFGL